MRKSKLSIRVFEQLVAFIFITIVYLPNIHQCNQTQTNHNTSRQFPRNHRPFGAHHHRHLPLRQPTSARPQVTTSSVNNSNSNSNKCQLSNANNQQPKQKQRVITVDRRNLTIEPRDSNTVAYPVVANYEGDQLQVAASNHSVHQFEPPASAELVVEPIASPFVAHQSPRQQQQQQQRPVHHQQLPTGDLMKQEQVRYVQTDAQLAASNQQSNQADKTDNTNQHLGERWLPVGQLRDVASLQRLNRVVQPRQQQQQQQLPLALNNQLSNLATSILAMRNQANQDAMGTNHQMAAAAAINNQNRQQRADQIESSAQTVNFQLANPLMSQYLYQMMQANQQPTGNIGFADLASPNFSGLPPQFAIAPGQMPLAAAAAMVNPNAHWTSNSAAVTRPARHLDVDEDGSSMVSYSLVPSGNPGGSPASTTGSNDAMAGLTQEQLMGVLQQLGAQQAAADQPGQLSASQLQVPPSAQNSLDSTMASLFENIFKGAMNATQQQPQQQQQQQQQFQLQQPMTIVNHQQQQPVPQQQQPQYNNNFRLNTTSGPTTLMDNTHRAPMQSNNNQQFNQQQAPMQHPQQPMQTTALMSPYQPHMAMGDQPAASAAYNSQQDAQMDPIYGAHPRRKPKKKRKKIDKADSGRNPVVRVQKRPRQQFYEHNSPTDLEPSATFHKWKYPWLYRPPYDDDEDEEEGETEINLRFFNNFSRMGPLGPLARSAAPATFIISLAFLILSNISLAATVIVHGISSFLRNMSPQAQSGPGGPSQSPHKLTGRLARILFYEAPQTTTIKPFRHGTLVPTSTTITTVSPSRSGNQTITRKQRATKLDRMIRSFSKAWI